jgi:hypothetical protein
MKSNMLFESTIDHLVVYPLHRPHQALKQDIRVARTLWASEGPEDALTGYLAEF